MESAEEGKNTLNLQLHRQSLVTVHAYVIEAGITVLLIPSALLFLHQDMQELSAAQPPNIRLTGG